MSDQSTRHGQVDYHEKEMKASSLIALIGTLIFNVEGIQVIGFHQ